MKDELAAAIGAEGLDRLIAAFGGTRINVPVEAREGDSIAHAIGSDAARALSAYFGGDRIDVPVSGPHPSRRQRIAELSRQGLSSTSIARALGCTRQWVNKVLAAPIARLSISKRR